MGLPQMCATALAAGPGATEDDLRWVESLFAASGKTVRLPEHDIDAACAVSGSGPAYVFLLAEALQAAAMEQGLRPDAARILTQQTLLGAATLLEHSEEDAPELRRKVTSPKGTTEAAIHTLQVGGFMELFSQALAANVARSRELAHATPS